MGVSIIAAASMVMEGIDLVSNLMTKVQAAGKIIAQAQAEGRTHLTDAEWAVVQQTADIPMEKLKQAIHYAPDDPK